MILLAGKIAGQFFLLFCKAEHIYLSFFPVNSQIKCLQREVQKLKAANAIMRQQIKREKIKRSFITKCRMIHFAMKFKIPRRRIRHYLTVSRSSICAYIKIAEENIFDLISKSSRPHSAGKKTSPEIVALIKRMKNNNPTWGYVRIAIHMWSLQIFISPSTVRRILLKPERYPDKKTATTKKEEKPLLIITASKPNSMWSIDITTLHLFVVFPVYVLGVIDHYSRRVFSLSSTFHPKSSWVRDECKTLFEKYGKPNRIITDNGSQFIAGNFRELLDDQGVGHIKTSVRHPQTNGKIERFFQSLKYEFMSYFFLRNRKQVDKLLKEYLTYYNQYRLHQAIEGQTPDTLYDNKPRKKPPKDAKQIRAPIEELSFGNDLLKAYRLKKAA